MKALKLFKPRREVVARPREIRGSRHERGYDSKWTRAAARHAKQFPICAECERHDIIVPMDVVDHKIPVTIRPDLRLDTKNRWSLCHLCHNGLKRRMEALAIKLGQVDLLILWCDEPETRPPALRGHRARRKREEMVV